MLLLCELFHHLVGAAAKGAYNREMREQRRFALGVALVLGLGACGPKAKASTVRPIAQGTVRDATGMFDLKVGYEPRPDRQVELVLAMNAVGTTEMDKVVIDVDVEGFEVTDGSAEWSGFVPPRQPQKYSVTLRALDGEERPTATVTVRRSVDSEVLFSQELAFTVSGSNLVAEPAGT